LFPRHRVLQDPDPEKQLGSALDMGQIALFLDDLGRFFIMNEWQSKAYTNYSTEL